MTLWNVAVTVEELIEAESEREACAALIAKVRAAGLQEHGLADAFESEDVTVK